MWNIRFGNNWVDGKHNTIDQAIKAFVAGEKARGFAGTQELMEGMGVFAVDDCGVTFKLVVTEPDPRYDILSTDIGHICKASVGNTQRKIRGHKTVAEKFQNLRNDV